MNIAVIYIDHVVSFGFFTLDHNTAKNQFLDFPKKVFL